VRLADRSGSDVQRVLDAGADGIMVPRVREPAEAAGLAADAIFSPDGQRGLGSTSRAGRWGLIPMSEYLDKGRHATLRMIQLEDLAALQRVEEFVAVPEVNGIFLGLGDLFLSTGMPATHPTVQALAARALAAATGRGIPCGIAVGTAEEVARYRQMGFPMIMISNDCTLFGRAAAHIVKTARGS
jgi:2-keto-3-deoxy-L-rhamnonate aldolase RhmA